MTFEQAHAAFMEWHLSRRTGERRGRLERGHREAEKLFCKNVWWKLRGSFDGLHPEYEVTDWRGLSYFCDFGWLHPAIRLVIEIKGFGPHVRDMDRRKYSNELNRETFLTAMGYRVISFSYDDIAERPDLCITLLRMLLAGYLAQERPIGLAALAERETIRLACSLSRVLANRRIRASADQPPYGGQNLEDTMRQRTVRQNRLSGQQVRAQLRGAAGGVQAAVGIQVSGCHPIDGERFGRRRTIRTVPSIEPAKVQDARDNKLLLSFYRANVQDRVVRTSKKCVLTRGILHFCLIGVPDSRPSSFDPALLRDNRSAPAQTQPSNVKLN